MDKIKYDIKHLFSKRTPTITYLVIISCVVIWFGQILSGDLLTNLLALVPARIYYYPGFIYTFLTTGFLHSDSFGILGIPLPNFTHILLNMYSLWVVGQILEPILGTRRYAVLYFVSLLGSSLTVFITAFWLGDFAQWYAPTIGASGAIFGLFGALIIVFKKIGANINALIFIVGLNIFLPFMFPNSISWQAHVGGLITGIVITYIQILIVKNKKGEL